MLIIVRGGKMNELTALMGVAVAAADILMTSLHSWRVRILTGVFWGLAGSGMIYFFSGLSGAQAVSILGNMLVPVLVFLELMLMVAMGLGIGVPEWFCRLYPGLMIVYPLAILADACVRNVLSLETVYLCPVFASCVFAVFSASVFVADRLRDRKKGLYLVSVLGIMVCIVTMGM